MSGITSGPLAITRSAVVSKGRCICHCTCLYVVCSAYRTCSCSLFFNAPYPYPPFIIRMFIRHRRILRLLHRILQLNFACFLTELYPSMIILLLHYSILLFLQFLMKPLYSYIFCIVLFIIHPVGFPLFFHFSVMGAGVGGLVKGFSGRPGLWLGFK